jgi:O-antigen/teichoic acid export membrane protein
MSKIAILPNALTRILLPQLSALLSGEQEIWRAFHLFRRAQVYNLVISCSLFVVGLWLLEPVVVWLLPNYRPGVKAAEVILLAGIPCSLTHNANAVLLALRRIGTYLKLVTFVFGLQATLFAYLYWNQQASAYTASVSLLAVFTGYAVLSNWTVLKIRKEALGTQG